MTSSGSKKGYNVTWFSHEVCNLICTYAAIAILHTSLYAQPFLLHIHTAHDLTFNLIYWTISLKVTSAEHLTFKDGMFFHEFYRSRIESDRWCHANYMYPVDLLEYIEETKSQKGVYWNNVDCEPYSKNPINGPGRFLKVLKFAAHFLTSTSAFFRTIFNLTKNQKSYLRKMAKFLVNNPVIIKKYFLKSFFYILEAFSREISNYWRSKSWINDNNLWSCCIIPSTVHFPSLIGFLIRELF